MLTKISIEFDIDMDDYVDVHTDPRSIASLVRSMLEGDVSLPESGKIVVNQDDMVTVHDFP